MKPAEILIVDDEIGIRALLSEILEEEGYQVALAENANEARSYRTNKDPSLVLLDIWMPGTDGITLLKEWATQNQLSMPVVMMSGHGTIETAVEATRIGAFDFLEKPITLQKLLTTVQRALHVSERSKKFKVHLDALGTGSSIQQISEQLEKLLPSKEPILLVGEPGAGHLVCARALATPGSSFTNLETGQKLVGQPLELLQQNREGLLVCEEIGAYNKTEQRGLIFALQQASKFQVQIVCTTCYPLKSLVHEMRFDPTLIEILSPNTVTLPPLRTHKEDIAPLAKQFLKELIELRQVPPREWSPEALETLKDESWPGNLAQLRATINSIAIVAAQNTITVEDTKKILGANEERSSAALEHFFGMPLREARESFERLYFQFLLDREDTNMSRVAEKAGLERTHLYRKLKQLNVRFNRKGAEE